jgi:hypothetical protein
MLHIRDLDAQLTQLSKVKVVDRDKSHELAQLVNWLEVENDKARYFGLGIDHRKDDKPKLLKKLLKKREG